MFEAIRLLVDGIMGCKSYNKTYNELYRMNDRELADIGVNRCDIHRVAKEAAKRR